MHLPRFRYIGASSLELASQILQEKPDAVLMAGGTDLLPRMKYRLDSPGSIISLRANRAADPTITPDGGLILDPLMTLSEVSCSSMVRERTPILSDAAFRVASQEIRNMGTLGGNLCQETRCLYYNQRHSFQFIEPCLKRGGDICYFIPGGKKCMAVFMSDTAPALISLGARIRITGRAQREIALEELYTGQAEKPLALDRGEVLSRIVVPGAHGDRGMAFVKISPRGGLEFATLSVALVLALTEGQTCNRARITVGAVGPAPVRALSAELMLSGKSLTDELFSRVAAEVATEVRPVPHHGHSRAYLKECLRAGTTQALHAAAARIGKD